MNAKRTTPPTPDDGLLVLDACHREILASMEDLTRLVADVERDGLTPAHSASARRICEFLSTTPRAHHEDEERHVFPPLVATGSPEVVQAVLRLQQDHDWLEEDWFELSPHLEAIAAGFLSYDLDVLREGTEVIAALYRDHIALEESLIYPELRARTSARARSEIGREMAARRRAARHGPQPA